MSKQTTQTLAKKIRQEGKQIGDVVQVGGKPHYIYGMTKDNVTLVSMDERKMLVTLWDKRDGS